MDPRVKEAHQMLKELEDKPKKPGAIGNLVGGFVTILVGVSLINEISK